MKDMIALPQENVSPAEHLADGVERLKNIMVNVYALRGADGRWVLIDAACHSQFADPAMDGEPFWSAKPAGEYCAYAWSFRSRRIAAAARRHLGRTRLCPPYGVSIL
jgi:hypothetical protein